ncbi:MAG: permease-like cell division protein FtsX [Bacteroidales bacterium]|nr:permease-like cell division protein FtsX [Candidatus Hennigimonas equi]
MASRENKITRRRLISAYISSVVSISLVLLLVGVASLLLVNAGNVSSYFKENMKVSVIFRQDTSEKQAKAFQAQLDTCSYIKAIEYVSKEQGIKEMENLLGSDFLSVFDTTPIPVSLNISMKAEYVTTESMEHIMEQISSDERVDDVVWQKSLIEALNSNLKTISLVLGLFIILLLFISFVLIGNTVRLHLYNKRFTIHTMRLVGATKSFICRPFVMEAIFQGVISALTAIMMILCALIVLKSQFVELFTVFRLEQLMSVMGIVVAAGIVICCLVTFAVVNRLVTIKKEELYY